MSISSHTSSSGIESDTDSSSTHSSHSDRTAIHDDDEGYDHHDDAQSSRLPETIKPNRTNTQYPSPIRNPYDDDDGRSFVSMID